jgi:hypothetical protein
MRRRSLITGYKSKRTKREWGYEKNIVIRRSKQKKNINTDKKSKELTSSMRRFEELLNWRVGSETISVLALFGEGARGLEGGVEAPMFC